jgi:hypothetical protein
MVDEARGSRSLWRERAIAATRRRLKRLEIEAHRIKAELARLESENENVIADELTQELHQEGFAVARVSALEPGTVAAPSSPAKVLRIDLSPGDHTIRRTIDEPRVVVKKNTEPPEQGAIKQSRDARIKRRKFSPAFWVSIGLHAVVFAVLAPMTFVIATSDPMPLFASMFDVEDTSLDEAGAAPIELVSFDEMEVPEDPLDSPADLAESVGDEFAPLPPDLAGEEVANLGQLNTLPTDVGTLMAGGGRGGDALGVGGRGAAGNDARLGTARFFGTPARADRIVFLVDNSASMKHGRMETTLLELARSVEAMSAKQQFYVVFYSDQAYPMFYPNNVMEPVAATPENKQKFYNWLQTVELCIGGALAKAIELAASLDPHVVYVLSDGDITSLRTMEKLTQANDWKFAVHSLGMGVAKPQDAQNLLAIAQAHGGTFQMVRPLPAAVQMAKARPIRSNAFGVSWGEGSQLPAR